MLKNYVKIALRNLWKQKGYAFINIIGLAVGIAFCALIFLYVRDELTYDRFHANADRIVRAHRVSFAVDGTVEDTDTSLPFPAGPAFVADIPEIEQAVRLIQVDHFVQYEDRAFEESVLYADPQFFEVFSFPLLQGTPGTALAAPNNIVLSESTARRLFGEQDPMGHTVSVRLDVQSYDFVVTGVARDAPGNSSIQFDVLLPIENIVKAVPFFADRLNSWQSSAYKTYLLLAEGASLEAARAKMPDFRNTYYPDEVANLRAEGRWSGDGIPTSYGLQPITEIHLTPEIRGMEPTSSPTYSYILAGLALAVLLIACINFMTLAIGRSAKRAQEIGVRKVVGAQRRQVMLQFWGEALLLSVLALGVGLALTDLFLPAFNSVAAKDLTFALLRDATAWAALLGITLVTGLLAGSYPALVLSRMKPLETLKNKLRLRGSNAFTRSLVVVQFALSIFLIASTLVMLDQLDYLRTRNLGFDKEQVVVVDASSVGGAKVLDRFRNELAGRPEIAGLTGTSFAFTRGVARQGFMHEGELVQVVEYNVESDFMDVLGMELAEGRGFDPNLATDSTEAIIVNEALIRQFGWTESVGRKLTGLTERPATDPVVVGVVKDFNFRSLHSEVDPMMLKLGPRRWLNHVLVRLAPDEVSAGLDLLQATWQDIAPDVPFQYSFLDDDLNRQYRAEERWSRIVGYGSFFAILIACLGLFGLTALTVTSRTKEIGIRKVLGASVRGVTLLLSKDFAKLVLVAIVLATPAAYFVMRTWLDDFAYRIELSGWTFLIAGLAALGVALLTVSYQAVKAALADPVNSLRYE